MPCQAPNPWQALCSNCISPQGIWYMKTRGMHLGPGVDLHYYEEPSEFAVAHDLLPKRRLFFVWLQWRARLLGFRISWEPVDIFSRLLFGWEFGGEYLGFASSETWYEISASVCSSRSLTQRKAWVITACVRSSVKQFDFPIVWYGAKTQWTHTFKQSKTLLIFPRIIWLEPVHILH